MLVGSVGTGKTTLIQSFLRDNESESLLSCTINTSYYTDASALQRQLEQPLDKVPGGEVWVRNGVPQSTVCGVCCHGVVKARERMERGPHQLSKAWG